MRKKQSYNIILLSLYILIFIGWSLACLLFAPGCHLLFPYSSSENNSVEVKYKIVTCNKKIVAPNWVPPVIQDNPQYPWIKRDYQVLPNFIGSLSPQTPPLPGNNKI